MFHPGKVFRHPFETRIQASDWNVIQAFTLLSLAEKHQGNRSFVLYAAFEMRNAIEQQMFTIIRLVSKEPDAQSLIRRCRKNDGLFRELARAEPNYTNLCYFMGALSAEIPIFPKIGQWEIRTLRRLWHSLSDYCHCPLSFTDQLDDAWYFAARETVVEAHNYMFSVLSQSVGTGKLDVSTAKKPYVVLYEHFIAGKISRNELRAHIKALRDSPPSE